MDLNKLRITNPLGLNSSIEIEWVKVSYFNYLRITACSDTNVTIDVLFSHNGLDIGPITTLKQNKIWTTRRIDKYILILLDWMKIRVSNDQLIENRFLIVNTLGKKHPSPQPQVENTLVKSPNILSINNLPIDNEENSGPMISDNEPSESRTKSPFKSILRGFKSKKPEGITKSVSFD